MPDPTPIGPPAVGGSGWIDPQNPTPIGPAPHGGSGAVDPQNPTPIGPAPHGGSGWSASTATTTVGPATGGGSGWVSAPRITSLTPDETSTAGGATITVEGTNLDGATTVTVDGDSVSFTQVDATTITFDAPAHAVGPVDVVVTTPSGSDTATLTYYAPLTISTLDPATGPTTGNTVVTITGTGFTGTTSVTFDGVPGTSLTFVDDTTITVRTPAHAAGAVDVVVTNSREDNSGDPAEFTYFDAAPVITSVTPDEAPTVGGATIVIDGVALGGVTTLTVDGASISFAQVSTTRVSFTAPLHADGVVPIVLTTPYGSDNATLTYYNPCRVTDVAPASGSITGGTVVRLTGSGFTDASDVDFGGTPGTIIAVVSDFELRVRTPAHAAGVVHVRVTNPRETSPVNGTDDQFAYVTAPTITSMTPTSGPTTGGTLVTLTGTDLDDVETILVGSADVDFTIVNPTTITFTTPAQPAGDVEVLALDANDAGASPPTPFTFYAPATVTAVAPAFGGTAGGTPVRITGTGFLGAGAVAFGSTPAASFTVTSDTQILAVSPAHALGVVHVRVTNPRETSPVNGPGDEFSYIPPPTLTDVDPDEGTVAGGTVLTLTGTNFVTGTTVTFDGKPGTAVTVLDSTTLTVVTPTSETAGPVDVVVTTPAGSSAPRTFTYTNVAPIAEANAFPSVGQAVLTVRFSALGSYDPDGGLLRRIHWDFGDGTTALAVSPVHTYTRPGTYTVTLTVTDSAGAEASDTVDVVVLARAGNTAPTARATASPVRGDAPLIVRFDGTSSFDPDGSIYSYEWDFGDGTTGFSPAWNHIYDYPGTYVATLRVTDNDGEVSIAPPILITVDEPIEMFPPEIAVLDPREGSSAGGTAIHVSGSHLLGVNSVKFCEPGTDDGPDAEFVILDDNTMLVVSPPAAGSMLVNIRASNRDYTSVPGPNSLFIYRSPPVAVITPESAFGEAPLLVAFSSAGSYSPIGPITYFWTFSGSPLNLGTYKVSYEANPVYLFQELGGYTVTLTVTDRRGITATATATVGVYEPAGGDGGGGAEVPWDGGGGDGGGDPPGHGGGEEEPGGGGGLDVDYTCDIESQHLRRGAAIYDPEGTGVNLFTEEWTARRLPSGVLFTVTVTVLTDYLFNSEKPFQHPARVFFGAVSMTGDLRSATTATRALVLNPRIVGASGMSLEVDADNGRGLFTPLVNGGEAGIEAGTSFTISGLAPARYDIAYAQVGFLNRGGGTVGDMSSAWIAVECDIEEVRRINGWTVATDPAMGGAGWTLGQHATIEPPTQRRKRR